MDNIAIITKISRPTTDVQAIYDSIIEQFQDFYWLVYIERDGIAVPETLRELAGIDSRIIINTEVARAGDKDVHFSQSFNVALNTSYVASTKWFYVCDDDNILHHSLAEIIRSFPDVDLIISKINDRRGVHYIDDPQNLRVDYCVGHVDWANAVFSSRFFIDRIKRINTQTAAADGELVRDYLRKGARVAYSHRVGGYYNHLNFYPRSRSDLRVAMVTLDNRPEAPWVKLANKSKQLYCDKRGLAFIFKSERYNKDRHPVWDKIPCMQETLDAGYDYAVWLDGDAAIANPRCDITGWFDDHDIYYSNDVYGLNFGVFALKNTATSRRFLRAIDISYAQFENTEFREQAAAAKLLAGAYKSSAKELPARVWNSYDDVYGHRTINVYQDGDFVLHLPARDDQYRLDRFSEVLRDLK